MNDNVIMNCLLIFILSIITHSSFGNRRCTALNIIADYQNSLKKFGRFFGEDLCHFRGQRLELFILFHEEINQYNKFIFYLFHEGFGSAFAKIICEFEETHSISFNGLGECNFGIEDSLQVIVDFLLYLLQCYGIITIFNLHVVVGLVNHLNKHDQLLDVSVDDIL